MTENDINNLDVKVTVTKKKKAKEPEIDWSTFDLSNCQKCGLCQGRMQVVQPVIVPNCKIMFIGEAPGFEEAQYGQPFIGRSGQLLNQCLMEVGINRFNCSIANVVQCQPPNNRPPNTDEVKACTEILDKAIKDANPSVIVPLGATALKRIARESKITKLNGHLLESPLYPNVKIVPVVHPSFALRDPTKKADLIYGLERVKAVADGNVQIKTSAVTYVDTVEKFDALEKDLRESGFFALDTETSSLRDWKSGYLICLSFSTKAGSSYVLPWIVGNNEYYDVCRREALAANKRKIIENVDEFCNLFNLERPKFFWQGTDVESRLKAVLADESIVKVLHNYAYDYKYLDEAGLTIKGTIYDTMIIHYLLDETRGKHGLDDLTLKYTDYGEYWNGLQKYIKSKVAGECDTYAIIPIDELIPYAGTDADVTLQIFNIMYPLLEKEGMVNLLNGFLMPLTKMLMRTEKNGFSVDNEYRQKGVGILSEAISKIETELVKYAPDTNFKSPKQLRELLFDKLRLPPIKMTKKGDSPSTDEEVLRALEKVHDVPKLLLQIRKLIKTHDTYFEGMGKFIWIDGRVHSNFLIHGTETGRLSSNNPNLQNLSRNDKELEALGIRVRDLFVSPNPETHYLVEVDYSQAELRLLAEYSRDRNLYTAFINGRDPHAELAVRIYYPERVAEMEAGIIDARKIVTKEQRQKAKTANFALAYGKGVDNFATENDLTYDEALHIHTVYWETYKDILVWKQNLLAEAYRCLYFKSYFGRKRRMGKLRSSEPHIRAEAEREGINFVIQSQASDYTLFSIMKATREFDKLGLDYRTVSFVHDSGVFEVNKKDINQFLTILREIMIKPPGVTIPMEIECKVGFKLGSLKEWNCNESGIWTEKVA